MNHFTNRYLFLTLIRNHMLDRHTITFLTNNKLTTLIVKLEYTLLSDYSINFLSENYYFYIGAIIIS